MPVAVVGITFLKVVDLSKLKICFLAGTLSQGGAERQLFYMLRALRQQGAEVQLLSLAQGEFWEQPIRDLGIPVQWVGNSRNRFGRLRRILQELKSWRPDLIQSQHFYTNAYAAAAARSLGSREIGAMRNNGSSEVEDCGRLSGRLNLHLPRVLAGNSKPALAYAEKQGISKSRLFFLPNVVDTSVLRPTDRGDDLPVRIVLAGRLERQKRIDRFLSVIARIKDYSTRPVKGIIVGSGSLKEELIYRAKSLGLLPNVVEFRGATSDMAAIYREAQICALTSDHEGTPNVVLEAMAAGLPVVATRVGGVPDLIQHGANGFLAETDQEHCLTQALLKLIENPRLRAEVGRTARETVVAHHSPHSLLEHLTRLYEFRFVHC